MMRFLYLLLFLLSHSIISYAQKNVITGRVIDISNGQPLTSATIVLEQLSKIVTSDINGRFTFSKLKPGVYSIKCSYVGFVEKIIDEVKVQENEETPEVVIALKQKKDMDGVVVTASRAKAAGETVSSLLIAQKNNASVSDGVSAEIIKKTPDKTTSDVLKRVSGASIQDDRFVVVRGLNDRYNASFINGAPLPSTESDRKAFAFDILPSAALDNLVIFKTATPDKSGEFAGGIIDIATKATVAKNVLQIGFSTSFNSIATGQTRYFSANSGKKDWIGLDDGTRGLPKGFPTTSAIRNDLSLTEKAELAKSFNRFKWGVLSEKTRPNYSFNISKSFKIDKREEEFISGLVSANYNRTYSFTSGNKLSFNYAIANPTQAPFQEDNFTDSIYNDEVIVALMGNISAKINNRNNVSFKNILSINTDNKLIKRTGQPDYAADSLQFINETVRQYTSNKIYSTQLIGNHVIGSKKVRLSWLGSYSRVNRDVPNMARTAYAGILPDEKNVYAIIAAIPNQTSGSGSMFTSSSNEKIYSFKVEATHSYTFLKKVPSTAKIGVGYQSRKRKFVSRVLGFTKYKDDINGIAFDNSLALLPEDQIYRTEHMGILPNGLGGFVISDGTTPNNNYDASSSTLSAFLMNEQKVKNKFRFIYGVRMESFNQKLNSVKNLKDTFNLDSTVVDILPSLNIVYSYNSKINFRLAYSQTVNRPEFRELAPFIYFDYASNFIYEGQTNLKRAKISNYDFRFEYYPGNAQLVSVSGFYKDFINPIEINSLPNTTNQTIYANAKSGKTYGIETEFRMMLSSVLGKKYENSILKRFVLSGNLALIKSQVLIDTLPNVDPKFIIQRRPMQGQSPYIINGALTYNDDKAGFSSTLSVNRAGERILVAGTRISPTIIEQSRTVVDLQFSKFLMNKFIELKLTVKDLLAQKLFMYYDFDESYSFTSADRYFSNNNFGRTVTLSVNFKFDK